MKQEENMLGFVGSAWERVQSGGKGDWGWRGMQLACYTEALAIVIVIGVLVQLGFCSVVPRMAILLRGLWMVPKGSIDEKEKEDENLDGVVIPGPDVNLDSEHARRRVRRTYQKQILDTFLSEDDSSGVVMSEGYFVNSRGIELFNKTWLPESGQLKAMVCFCHGYGDTCTYFFEGVARKLAAKNFAVIGMDYAGFGLSAGLHGYIPSFDRLVDDVVEHYSTAKDRPDFRGLPCFLLGESMGGAVALKAVLRRPDAWDGAILVAPMCKIAEEMYPPWIVMEFLKVVARIIPRAKLVPTNDIALKGFRDLRKRAQALQNVIAYKGKPRLGTALSLLRATADIEKQLNKVALPLLILHGAADVVTDVGVSRALYQQASTTDKTMHLYQNAWHSLLAGEPDATTDKVMNDIFNWLDSHSRKHSTDSRPSII